MFSIGLYLNYEPSHLVWMGIDPVAALKPYVDRIPHAQAKDIQLSPTSETATVGRERRSGATTRWMSAGGYRVPGLNQIDWRRLIDALYEGGFDGVLSVEHEDPVWGGTEAKVKTGLQVANNTLSPHIVSSHPHSP